MDDLREFFDDPGYGTQTNGRLCRLESEPGRARSSGAEKNRVGPNGAEWSRQRLARAGMRGLYFRLDAMFQPGSNQVPTGGKKKLAQVVHFYD